MASVELSRRGDEAYSRSPTASMVSRQGASLPRGLGHS